MAKANVFYKGEEMKFAIGIKAAGFDMDTDDFELEVTNNKESFSVTKTGQPDERGTWKNEDGSLVVFYEEETVTIPPAEEGGEPTTETVKNWFGIIDTQYFINVGELKVISTAYVIDAKAADGVRKCIGIDNLGTLKNK